MRAMMKWMSAVMAMALMIGFSGISRADEAPAKPAVGTISGTVTGIDGKPAAGITVNLLPVMPKSPAAPKADIGDRTLGKNKDKGDKPPRDAGKNTPVATATTAADGTYTLPGVPVGDYTIVAGDRKSTTGSAHQAVTIKEGDTVTVNLKLVAPKPKKPAA